MALCCLGDRTVRAVTHPPSFRPTAVSLRFCAFAVQMGIGVWWAWRLLTA